MLPSLFSLPSPASSYLTAFVIYGYLLPIMLYGLWASLSLMDMAQAPRSRVVWTILVLALPWIGGAAYLLFIAKQISRAARYAAVTAGFFVWLVPFAFVLHGAWGPLGPKAL
jgi:hypothetical protein